MKLPRTTSEFKDYCRKVIACAASASIVLTPSMSLSIPQGGMVSAGQATIADGMNRVDIHQGSDKAVIDWRGFDVNAQESVEFHQPGSSSLTVNRVNGNAPSIINGNLKANGNVMVINPNGMLFGGKANVDVNGIIASTADGDNASLMKDGKLALSKPGKPEAAIINQGRIKTKDGGKVGIIAPNISNQGIIEARLGTVQLASGDTATVDLYGDGLIEAAVSDKVKSQLVENNGIISAPGGSIAITAAAGDQIVDSLINLGGVLDAKSVGNRRGTIKVQADGSNAVKGNAAKEKGKKSGTSKVLVTGILDASGRNAGERGGLIQVLGDNIALLADSFIDASGHSGLTGTTNGKPISAQRDGSAGGDIRIGGDYLGLGETATAKTLYVDPGAFILNDSIYSGDAGRTIFWSDGTTQFYGNVFARALGGKPADANTLSATVGGNTGDGGFVETSGHEHLDAGGYVDLTASNGTRGTYFLDPTNVTIYGNVTSVFNSANLVGAWSLDEGAGTTVADSSGNGNNGAFVNTPTWVTGQNGNAVNFTNASGSYINVPNAAPLDFGTGDFTVSTWAKATFAADAGGILYKGTGTFNLGGVGWEIRERNGGRFFEFCMNAGAGACTRVQNSNLGALTPNTWYYIAFTYQRATGTVTAYINDAAPVSALNVTSTYTDSYPLIMGSAENGSVDGAVDDVRLYNNALSANDVAELYGSRFTVAGIEKMSQTANVSIQATNNITLDLGGDTIDMTNNRNLTLTAGNQITTASAGTITTTGTGTINFNAADYNQLHGLTLNGAGGTIITADTINLGASLGGTGTLTLQPSSNAQPVNLNNGVAGFALDTTEIGRIQDGWSQINIGKLSAGDVVNIGTSTWTDPVRFYGGAAGRNVLGTLTGTGNASFHFQGADNISIATTGSINTAGQAVTFAGNFTPTAGSSINTNGGAFTHFNQTYLYGGMGTTINTSGGTITMCSSCASTDISMPIGAAGRSITLNAGTGTINLNGLYYSGSDLSASAATINVNGTLGSPSALGNVSLSSTNSLTLPTINAGTILARTTGATSDITIPSGKTLTATGAGNAITLASGRNVINNAGAGALSTPSGRSLLYLGALDGNTFGGLTNDFTRYGCPYATCGIPTTGNGFLYAANLTSAGGSGGGGSSTPFSEPVVVSLPIAPEAEPPTVPALPSTPTEIATVLPTVPSPNPVTQIGDSNFPVTVQRISIDPTPILVDARSLPAETSLSSSTSSPDNSAARTGAGDDSEDDQQSSPDAEGRSLSTWDGMLTITPELARRFGLDLQHWE